MTSISIALSPFPQSLQIRTRRATILYSFLSNCRRRRWRPIFPVRASADSVGNGGGSQIEKNLAGGLQGMISSLPTTVSAMRSNVDLKTTVGLCIASVVFLAIVARQMVLRKNSQKYQGSVADLVRRGQLRSDRRSVSKPLKYEDPFNNPLVKAGKSNSTIEMCGKVYRLAPVTLTKEEQSVHQKRRSRAYQWKRPTTFLKEGDSVPPDVDPDTVKWIPANHPFATTVSDIDENLAQNNVYQKHGVPFRIKAEHEEMQKRLEALQNSLRSSSKVSPPLRERGWGIYLLTLSNSHLVDKALDIAGILSEAGALCPCFPALRMPSCTQAPRLDPGAPTSAPMTQPRPLLPP